MEISVFCWFWTEIRGDRKIETQWSRWMACWDWSFKVNVLRSVDSQFPFTNGLWTDFDESIEASARAPLTRRRRLTTDWRLIFIFLFIAEIISGAGLQTPAVTLPRGRRPTVLANSGVMAAAGGAAATSVVVLDRGNNTTCTINLHGKHDKSFISINLGHCPRCQFVGIARLQLVLGGAFLVGGFSCLSARKSVGCRPTPNHGNYHEIDVME